MTLNIKNTVVAFDLDDTLYNEIDYLKSAYKAIAFDLDDKNSTLLYAKMFSLYRDEKNVFEFLAEKYKVEKQKLINNYRNHIPNIKPFNNVILSFEKIKKMGGKIAIITDGRVKTQTNKINSLGLKKYLDLVIISEAIGTEKPNENNFKTLENNFPECNYVYIADNLKKDFITPNNRNWISIGLIDNGLNIHNNFHYFSSNKNNICKFLINGYDEIIFTNI